MYIIERLKHDYPQLLDTIETYDKTLRKYHGDECAYKIFDDKKDAYSYVDAAYKALSNNDLKTYNKYMCMYEKSFNDDTDFLTYFIVDMFEDYSEKDIDKLSVEEKQAIINTEWKKRGIL